jgi:hypothetical protein
MGHGLQRQSSEAYKIRNREFATMTGGVVRPAAGLRAQYSLADDDLSSCFSVYRITSL